MHTRLQVKTKHKINYSYYIVYLDFYAIGMSYTYYNIVIKYKVVYNFRHRKFV